MGLLFKSIVLALLAFTCTASFSFDELSSEIERVRDSLAVRMLGEANALVPIPEEVRRLGLVALEHLLAVSGLNKTLEGKGPFTLFAPNDEAFREVPEWVKKAISNKTVLAEVLKFHALPAVFKSSAAKDNLMLKTAQGQKLRINIYAPPPTENRRITAQCAPVEMQRVDKLATNGVVHVLKGVMIPPAGNAVVSLAGSAGFKTLVKAVKVAGLVKALSGEGPFTIFAPTDEAFSKLPKGTLAKLLKNKAELTKVLTYHVSECMLCSAGIYNGHLKTMEGQNVRLTVKEAGIRVNRAYVLYADASITNGVIHVIDKVLLPPSFSIS